MKYEILFLGKTKTSFLSEGIFEYQKRLKHYTSLNIKTVKPPKIQGSDTYIIEKESGLLLDSIQSSTLLVALDIRGKQYSSPELSLLVERWEISGIQHVTFVIGGPLGLSPELLSRADLKISLSLMTFTHDMVRLFLLEQIYRAYTIKAGEKYHK